MWVSASPADGACPALDGVQPEGSVRSGRRAWEGQLSQSQSVSLDPGGCTRGNSCSRVLRGGPGARGLWARTDRRTWAEAGPRRWLQTEPEAVPVLCSVSRVVRSAPERGHLLFDKPQAGLLPRGDCEKRVQKGQHNSGPMVAVPEPSWQHSPGTYVSRGHCWGVKPWRASVCRLGAPWVTPRYGAAYLTLCNYVAKYLRGVLFTEGFLIILELCLISVCVCR